MIEKGVGRGVGIAARLELPQFGWYILVQWIPAVREDLHDQQRRARTTGQPPCIKVAPHPHELLGTCWTVKVVGGARPIVATITRMQAIEAARTAIDVIGERSTLRIYERDGRIRDELTLPRMG